MVRPLIFENPQYITVSGLLWPISNYVNSSRERKLVDVSFLLSRNPLNEKLMALLSKIPKICDVIDSFFFLTEQ